MVNKDAYNGIFLNNILIFLLNMKNLEIWGMYMKLINPDCKKCEATLEINLDKLQAFCPYCGSRLMIDVDKFVYLSIENCATFQLKIAPLKKGCYSSLYVE